MPEKKENWLTKEKDRLRGSLGELKPLRNQTLAAMLLAVTVVLDYVGGFQILGGSAKITPPFLGIATTGALLGPIPAMINGALCDVIMWLIKPTGAYFPGYTISGLLGGLIYGICLYRREGRGMYFAAAISKLLVNALINVGLNTVWTSMFLGKAYLALLPGRALKNLIAWPVESILLAVVLYALQKSVGKIRRK